MLIGRLMTSQATSVGNREKFPARLIVRIAERLIDCNRLFGSLPDTQ